MSEQIRLALLSSLRQAQSQSSSAPSIGFESSPWPMFTPSNIGGESSCQVSQITSTIPNNSIPTCSYNSGISEINIDTNVVSPPTDFKSSNISFLTSQNSSHDTPAIFDGNNLSLGMILTMSAMNQVENPYEPRPMHPSVENTIDWFSMMGYQHNNACHADTKTKEIALENRTPYRRQMSVEQVLDILNDIPSIDDDESFFHLSMLTSYEVGGIDSHVRPIFDDSHISDSNYAASESSSGMNTSANEYEDSSLFEPHYVREDICKSGMTDYSLSKEHDKSYNDDDNEDALDHLPPVSSLLRLRGLMSRSRHTQNLLQDWDKKNGLPRSHCCTMMHTNRSRRQLEEGRILPKWNGTPLIRKRCDDELRTTDQPKRKKRVKRSMLQIRIRKHV